MGADLRFEREKTLRDVLQGPKYPDKEFIRSGATFAEVYAMAAHLRAALADSQNGETVVCLAAEDKAIIAAALLASLAGGPTLLLPYAFSPKSLARMQRDTGFTTAISEKEREFPPGVKVLCPQSDGSPKRADNTSATPAAPAASRSLLLQIFTGGSTGKPQVWSKTGENIFSEGFFLANRFAVTEHDCIMATIPPYHIYGLLFSVVLPLVSSATVVNETPSFPAEIVRAAREQEITILASVPAHYRGLRGKKMTLRLAFSSAGMLDTADNAGFCRHNQMGIVEVYGSTETGGIATRNMALGEDFFTPFPTIDWRITGHRLAVRSPYISPDLAIDTDGFFTTNDRAEAMGPDKFSLKGRIDTVTKVGGKRVDLDEISSLIKHQAGVNDCVVLALPESGGREHLIGTLIQGDRVDIEMLKKTLADTFEPYALPRRMKTVARIPLMENGKYDWLAIAQLLEK